MVTETSSLRLLMDPPMEPVTNMARDLELAEEVRRGEAPPTLRVYRWDRPAISIGRRQRADDLLKCQVVPTPLVRRPTGGGTVVHRLDELTYALALPRSLLICGPLSDLTAFFHRMLRGELIQGGWARPEELSVVEKDCGGPYRFCFEAPVCGDLTFRGVKAGGAALRVWRDGLLVQGSIQGLPVEYNELADAVSRAVRSLFEHEAHPAVVS